MTTTKKAPTVVAVAAWWDDQDPACASWYAESRDAEGYTIDDSLKVWFPARLGDFAKAQADEVRAALVAAFPDAEVEVR